MPTHTSGTRSTGRLFRHEVVAATRNRRACPRENRERQSLERQEQIREFVTRTTISSGVPLLIADPIVIDQIARVLS
jgi:hypothetical protein